MMNLWRPYTATALYHKINPPGIAVSERNKIKVLSNQRYSSRDERLLADVYLPQTGQLSHPTILLIHGGGWASRSKEDMQWSAEYFSRRGYTVVNVNYRLAPKHLYPAPLIDLKTAYEWMLSNKENFRIDTKKIIFMGYSAGGHLASLLSGWARSGRDGYSHLDHVAVVGGGLPSDFMVYPQSPYINRFTSFYRDENPDLYLEASPLNFVSKNSAPHYLFHAIGDKLVEFEQMTKLAEKLKNNQIKVETFSVKRWDHIGCFLFATEPLVRSLLFIEDL